MISLKITVSNIENAEEIVDFLLAEKMILEAVVTEKVTLRKIESSVSDAVQISAITKALLFKTINTSIREISRDPNLTIYSLPVLDMDWDKQKELIDNTLSV